MDNILINFTTTDQSGLTQSAENIETLLKKDDQLRNQVIKTAEAMEARDKAILDGSIKTVKGLETLNQTMLQLGKAAGGQEIVKVLTQISAQMNKIQGTKGTDIPFIINLQKRVKELESQLKTTVPKVGKDLPDALNKIKPGSDKATQALSNFGRVVQDAPFGILGIANNIDPLVESFGRLKTETGSTQGALKGMLGSLAGPAGIGIAISVATSLAIAFGDELVDMFSEFFPSSEKAIEKQKAFNDALREANDIMIDLSKSYASLYAGRSTDAQKALSLGEAQGKNETQLFILKQRANQASRLEQIYRLASLGLDEQSVKENEALLELRQEQLQSLLSQATAQKELSDDEKLRVDLLKSQIGGLKSLTTEGRSLVEGIKNTQAEAQEQAAQFARETYEAGIRSATALAEAKVILAKRGSIQERDAEIAAIKQRAAAAKALDVNLTPGERAKIEADAQKAIQDVHFNFQKKALQDAKTGIDAQVTAAKEGSQEQFDFQLQSLELARQVELKDQELTANKKLEINNRYYKQALDMAKAFNLKRAENELNTQLAGTQSQINEMLLNNTEASNAEMVNLKKKLIDDQAELEAIGVNNSEKNEELRLAKIKAIYSKALLEKQNLERGKRAAEISQQFDPREADMTNAIDSISQIMSAVGNSEILTRSLAKQTFEYKKSLRELEAAEDFERLQNNEITAIEFDARERQRAQVASKDKIQLKIEEAKAVQALENDISDYVARAADVLFSNAQANVQRDEEQNQARFDKKLITEREFNDRKEQLDKKAAQVQKNKALFDIGIELAKSLFAIQAQASILLANPLTAALAPAAFAQIPVVVAEAAFSSALVLARKYKEGEVNIDGPGTTTSDSIPAWLSKGESVINAKATASHRLALEAINEGKFHDYLLTHELPKMFQKFSMPEVPGMFNQLMSSKASGSSFDYDKLATVLADKIAENPHVSIHIDENGLVAMIDKGLSSIRYKNKKLDL